MAILPVLSRALLVCGVFAAACGSDPATAPKDNADTDSEAEGDDDDSSATGDDDDSSATDDDGKPTASKDAGKDAGNSKMDAGTARASDARINDSHAGHTDANVLGGGTDATTNGDAAEVDQVDGGGAKVDGGANAGGADGGMSSTGSNGAGACSGSTPHGCYAPRSGNPEGCPPQIHEQSAFYPPVEEWEACSSPYYERCYYDKPTGGEAYCSCDLGLHWLCMY